MSKAYAVGQGNRLAFRACCLLKSPASPFGLQEWGSKAFNSIVCSKLSGVLHLLRRGINVFLVDADVAFQVSPHGCGARAQAYWAVEGTSIALHAPHTQGHQVRRRARPH